MGKLGKLIKLVGAVIVLKNVVSRVAKKAAPRKKK